MNANNEAEMKKWFPGLYRKKIGTKCEGKKPKLRIICFPPAGCAEDLFSTEGTGARRDESPLLEWARDQSAEVLAVQYPGRANRKGDVFAASVRDIARPLHSILREYFADGVPYVVVAHSVGTWIAYEFLRLRDESEMETPDHVFFSSFPSPAIPDEERPWNVNEGLSEDEFKVECRRWNINEIVFTHIWSAYHPLLRADFTLFDQYTHDHNHDNESKFAWPLTVFSANEDGMITPAMCGGWQQMTSGTSELIEIDGHHLFPLEKEQKKIWLSKIVKALDGVMDVIELKSIYG